MTRSSVPTALLALALLLACGRKAGGPAPAPPVPETGVHTPQSVIQLHMDEAMLVSSRGEDELSPDGVDALRAFAAKHGLPDCQTAVRVFTEAPGSAKDNLELARRWVRALEKFQEDGNRLLGVYFSAEACGLEHPEAPRPGPPGHRHARLRILRTEMEVNREVKPSGQDEPR
jgi:hypothetical protein